MANTADYLIHEGYNITVYAEVTYGIEPASGDGWDEPHEEAHAYVISATLRQVEKKANIKRLVSGELVHLGYLPVVTQLGEAPQWVIDIIKRDEDWLTEIAADDGYEDDSRDRLHDDREVA